MAQIVVLEGQSLFDIAIQECGSVEAVFEIAGLNGLAITDGLVPGSLINVTTGINKPVADYYARNKLKPATGDTTSSPTGGGGGGIDDLLDDGIDFMAVEVDNIVS